MMYILELPIDMIIWELINDILIIWNLDNTLVKEKAKRLVHMPKKGSSPNYIDWLIILIMILFKFILSY